VSARAPLAASPSPRAALPKSDACRGGISQPAKASRRRAKRLARDAAIAGGTAPCVLNAANEVAVHAFLEGRLPFLGIGAVIEETLSALPPAPVRAFESLYDADREARAAAAALIETRVG